MLEEKDALMQEIEADDAESIQAEATEETAEEQVEVPAKQETEKSEQPKISILGKEYSLEDAERIFKDYENDNKWKRANEERGRELNEALALKRRLDADANFKQYIESFEDERLLQLKGELPEETAKHIHKLEMENRRLQQEYTMKEAEKVYVNEETELLNAGVPGQTLAEAYQVLIEMNPVYMQANKRSMPLKEALAITIARGGGQDYLQAVQAQQNNAIIKQQKAEQKANLPTAIAGKQVAREKPQPQKTKTIDDYTEEAFNDPVFKDFPL